MSRPAHPSDFKVPVAGIGDFLFGRRNMADGFAIERAYIELTGELIPPGSLFGRAADQIATLKVLTVKAPDGWDLDAIDMTDLGTFERLKAVWEALRTAEETFRGRVPPVVQAAGAGDGGDA